MDMSSYMPPGERCDYCGAEGVPLYLEEDNYGDGQNLWCADCCREHGKEPNPWPNAT